MDSYLVQNWQNKDNVEMIPTRNGYGEGLVLAGEQNENVVVLCADLTESTRSLAFKEAFPDRFVEMGVAEQNMAAVASGMAATGKIPFISSYAVFSPGLSWVQVRTTMAYNNQKVIIGGAHAGISVGPDGATHQALEDIAIMRVIPNMTVIVPADVHETRRAVLAALEWDTPIYLRFARDKSAVISTVDAPFEIGKGIVLREGTDMTFVACGILVYEALLAAEALAQEGVSIEVINMHTIKPLDRTLLEASARKTGRLVTIEEHQRIGGLGSAVTEALAAYTPVPILRIGIDDQFGQSGEPQELLDHYGLTSDRIVSQIRTWRG